MITAAQATQYIGDTIGASIPAFVVDAAVARIAVIDAALSAQYDAGTVMMIEAMAVTIVACAGSPRRIASQGATSGASRSFTNDSKALTALRRSLKALDSAGLTSGLVGADPAAASFFMVTGDDYQPRRSVAPTPPPPVVGDYVLADYVLADYFAAA